MKVIFSQKVALLESGVGVMKLYGHVITPGILKKKVYK